MLEYIKSQIRERSAQLVQESATVEPSDVPNETITEYAHLFQELDDISDEGTEYGKERKLGIDIPLVDDDAEVETIEINLDGRLEDVPGDATAPTVTESYETMKTYDKFFEEAACQISRLPRESDDAYNKRVSALADKMYEEYCVDAEAIGAFGFTKIDVTDDRVPSKLNVNFGAIKEGSDTSFIGKVKAFFATDADHKITKKQLDSVRLVQEGAFANIGKPLMDYMTSKYNVPSGSGVWDVCTPNNIIVPTGNGDSFCVVLEYTNEITNQKEYFGWTRPVREGVPEDCEKVNMESFVSDTHYENKDAVIQEAVMAAAVQEKPKKRKFSRFFQEAIDMGTGDAGSDTDNAGDAGAPPAPPTEGAEQGADATASTDATPAEGQQETNPEDKETAAVNNVSSEIAEKVADQTKADANDGDENITFPDETGSDDSSVSFDSAPAEGEEGTADEGASIDDQLDDLDTANEEGDDELGDEEGLEGEDESGSIENEDIESMSMEEIMNNASDKLKSMPLSELKEFLNGNTSSDFQEAFILTKKNINKEVDIHLRKALGILNDNKMNIDKLMKKFKMEGHELNRILVKAAKTGDVYSSDEQNELKKLNSALSDLMTSLKKSNDSSYVSSVKRKIEAFTKQSKIVSAFVEDKMDKPVQEGFVQEGLFLSDTNVKKRLGSKIPPVHADLMEIVRAYDGGKLTKGKLMKMYKPAKTDYSRTYGYGGTATDGTVNTTTVNKSYEIDTIQMDHIHSLLKVLGKTLRKSKVQRAFTSDELEQIDSLAEALDDFIDYLESLIIDTSDNKSLVDQVGKDAKKLVTLLANVYNFCSGLESVPRHRRYEGDDALAGAEGEGLETVDGSDEGLAGDTSEEPMATDGETEESVTDDESVEEPATDGDDDSSVEETPDDDNEDEGDEE